MAGVGANPDNILRCADPGDGGTGKQALPHAASSAVRPPAAGCCGVLPIPTLPLVHGRGITRRATPAADHHQWLSVATFPTGRGATGGVDSRCSRVIQGACSCTGLRQPHVCTAATHCLDAFAPPVRAGRPNERGSGKGGRMCHGSAGPPAARGQSRRLQCTAGPRSRHRRTRSLCCKIKKRRQS